MRRSLSLPIGFILLATLGCGTQTASTPTPSPVATRVEDCRGATETGKFAPTPNPGVDFRTMTVDGKLRDYRLFRPPQLDVTKPVPLVIILHGSPIDAAGFETVIHFDAEAVSAGLLTASPNGCAGYWSYSEGGSKTADEDFIEKVFTDLKVEFRISNVFVIGASAGSRVVYRLACDFAPEIKAVASVAGTMVLKDACSPARPVSVLEMHGTADEVSPWEGGGPHGAYPVEDVNQRWRALDGCVGDPVVTQSRITVSSVWNHCSGGAEVRLDKIMGGKHTWFGDPMTGEPDANKTIWGFFSSVAPPLTEA